MAFADVLQRYFDPEVYNSLVPTPGVELAFHPQLEVLHQGTAWHRAGLVSTADQHEAVLEAERAIYPGGLRRTDGLPIETVQTVFAGPGRPNRVRSSVAVPEPWTNEQRVALMYDPPVFEVHGFFVGP